jgi:Ca2+-binding EF-hand superfamily protein
MNGGGFSAETMSGLLDAQEESDSLASAIIDEADTDGDGKLSAAEIAASMGVSDASEIEDVFAALDADGDGTASADELSAGLEASRPQGPPPPHGGRGGPPSATEMASTLLERADGDADGALGLGEIASALGQEEADLTEAFASLDSNSDGSLAADELTSAIQSMLSRQMAAYGSSTAASASSVSLAA